MASRTTRTVGLRPPCVGGRYVVARFLGRGAQARVYLAWDLRLRQWRAVKVLAEELAGDEVYVARFEHEAATMAELSHPNLVRVVDVHTEGDLPYLVMELGRGGTAGEWSRRNGPMPPRMALRLVAQCAEGLRYAHERGVIHRDVKPANLLIHEDGRAVVIDFGIARSPNTTPEDRRTYGTLAYMAPEQRADPSGAEPRADVYSLGVTLLSLLTGRPATHRALAEATERLPEGVPKVVGPVLLAACHPDREQRTPDMVDLCAALRRLETQLPEDRPGRPLLDRLIPLPEATPPTQVERDEDLDHLRAAPGVEEDEPTWVSEAGPEPATPQSDGVLLTLIPVPRLAAPEVRPGPETAVQEGVAIVALLALAGLALWGLVVWLAG